jgi:hypothetical protein
MGEIILDIIPHVPLSLVNKSHCFDNLKDFYILLACEFKLGVDDLFHRSLLNAVKV